MGHLNSDVVVVVAVVVIVVIALVIIIIIVDTNLTSIFTLNCLIAYHVRRGYTRFE